jgi:2-polyprenyl-3-methyl-5-hydroxy-6-metoxy-1,4-benzoquinol methylase
MGDRVVVTWINAMDNAKSLDRNAQLDTSSHQQFVQYYAAESQSDATRQRFEAIRSKAIDLLRKSGNTHRPLDMLDIGCGAGTQCALWAAAGDRAHGIDINAPLIELARERAQVAKLDIRFDIGSATALPHESGTIDVCLIPELLEHVPEWEPCLVEAVRVLRPGGVLFLSTTNVFCPVQHEYRLPLYSWYPGFAKRLFERKAVTSWPSIANYARYPAVHWFSYYGLSRFLGRQGMRCFDRFAMMEPGERSAPRRIVVGLLQASSTLRLLGQIGSTGTIVFALKPAEAAANQV